MTALLTDEEIAGSAWQWGLDQPSIHLPDLVDGFENGARFARSIYEARLAEEKVVRAGLVEALGVARTRFRLVMSAEGRGFGIDYIDGCAAAAIEEIDAALLTAKEIK